MVPHGYEEKVEGVGGKEGQCGTLTCLHGTWVTGGNHYSCGTQLKGQLCMQLYSRLHSCVDLTLLTNQCTSYHCSWSCVVDDQP